MSQQEAQTAQENKAMRWTPQQKQVIDLRDRSLLVSAAAGSGKTAVLVQRIIAMITDPENRMDVDELLVVTFTNAAAAEMRERVLAAIEKAAGENPEDLHLQRQISLIHHAQITTIDSFCLKVVQSHFHRIGLEPGFRIADEGELTLLQEDVCDAVLEDFYEEKDPAFLAFADSYSTAKNDEGIRKMILELYRYSQSDPWPEEWLEHCSEEYQAQSVAELEKKPWVKSHFAYLSNLIRGYIATHEEIYRLTTHGDGPAAYGAVLRDDIWQMETLLGCETFAQWQAAFAGLSWKRMPALRKYQGSEAKKNAVADTRKDSKTRIANIGKTYFSADIREELTRLAETAESVRMLVTLTKAFSARFAREKAKKNIQDFSDIEHNALRILVDEKTKEPTETAAEYRRQFRQVMIDEYQDSNYVQEALLTAVSRVPEGEENLFMVGDVKQSIYRFRLARPELFMQKYRDFSTEEGQQQRIDLHKNFRSRPQVIDGVNAIFGRIMGADLGNVEYNAESALYQGGAFPQVEADLRPECLVIPEDIRDEEKRMVEARVVAHRIRRMVESQELPGCSYRDVVILLRSLSGWAESFQRVFEEEGIPLVVASRTGYFSAGEVQVLLAMLRVLDNPRQDYPLTTLMRSPIGDFSDEELAQIRTVDGGLPFYACVTALLDREETPFPELREKLRAFWAMVTDFRQRLPYTAVHVLIQQIYDETGYRDYVTALPAGLQRRANLDMLLEKAIAYEKTSYRGLYHFVRYMNQLKKYEVDYGEAEIFGEGADAVRLMTIHKSKGLEFSVVFVCGMAKSFNQMDANGSMILHPEFGVGLKWADREQNQRKDTLIRQIFSLETKKENLGEELRVLYVALTRAKDKLILTGIKPQKTILPAEGYGDYQKLHFPVRMQAGCYFDWVLPVIYGQKELWQIHEPEDEDLLLEELKEQSRALSRRESLLALADTVEEEKLRQLDEILSWRYPHGEKQPLRQKISVSELKHRAMEEAAQLPDAEPVAQLFSTEISVPYLPRFIQTQEENQGALRGTAMHRFLECIDFAVLTCPANWYEGIARLKEMFDELVATGRMEQQETDLLSPYPLYRFLSSETAARMGAAARKNRLFLEQPFVMSLPASRIWEVDEEEEVLLQGIMDVFWEEEDGLVLLDYKTDRVTSAKELIRRYREQLLCYGEALDRRYAGRGLKVKEILIYSFSLHEIVRLS